MTRKKLLIGVIFQLVFFAYLFTEASALTNEETSAQLQFNFNLPGARALGQGGAFLSTADDATASAANPAGLIIPRRPEFLGEVRFTKFTTLDIPVGSRAIIDESGTPATEIFTENFSETVTSLSFLSFVYPISTKNFSLALFRQELANFKQDFETDLILIPIPGASDVEIFPVRSQLDFSITNLGGSAGVELARGLSLGAAVQAATLDVESALTRFDATGTNPVFSSTIDESATAASFTLGGLWKLFQAQTPLKEFSVGGVFRSGPRFDLTESINFSIVPGQTGALVEYTVKVPDVYGAGISYRQGSVFSSDDTVTLSLDVIQIQYSDLLENFQITLAGANPEDFTIQDATQIHGGVEYNFFAGTALISLRGGVFTDPDHSITFQGEDLRFLVLFPEREDQTHVTFGGGVSLGRFRIDGAVNLANSISEGVITAFYRF